MKNEILALLEPDSQTVEARVKQSLPQLFETKEKQILWRPNPDKDGVPNPQKMALESKADVLGYGGSGGGGKLQPLDAKVLTPKGWRLMGDLSIGDVISDPTTGGHSTIIGIYPNGVMPIYKITFDDGSYTRVGLDHLWAYKPNANKRIRPRTKVSSQRQYAQEILNRPALVDRWNYLRIGTTKVLLDELEQGHHVRIPLTEPLLFTVNGRTGTGPCEPYMLGVLLGDGSLPSMVITACDDQIRDYLLSLGFSPQGDLHTDNKPKSWRAVGELGRKLKYWLNDNELQHARSWEKFTPDYVFTANIQYRLEFLQGLMDADGYVDERGRCYFTSTSEQLADGVRRLVWSLGGKTFSRMKYPFYTHNGEKRDGRPAYELHVQLPQDSAFFRLDRKKERCTNSWNGGREMMRAVSDIEYIGDEEAQCIKVDSPNGLYITDDYIVTHNTDLLLGLAATRHKHSVIFRRVFPSLRGIIERSREIFNVEGKEHSKDSFNESLHRWQLDAGRMIEFEACQLEKDKEKQRGRPRDFYGFDEVTEFSRTQFEFITAWNRTTIPGQRYRVVMTFNPPQDENGSWIIDYFLPWFAYLYPDQFTHPNPAEPGELRWYATVDGKEVECESGESYDHNGEMIIPRSRTFIPARLSDNPHLANTGYEAVLQSLPEPLRSQLLYGDFAAIAEPDPWQVIPTTWVKLAQKRWSEREEPKTGISNVGVDVARGGKDKTVIDIRRDNWFAEPITYLGVQTPDGPTVAAKVNEACPDAPCIYIDVIGVGSSAYDSLKPMYESAKVVPFNGAEKSAYRDRSLKFKMRNKRAEMYWRMREALDPEHGDDIALPPGNEVVADLCVARYKVTTAGIQIEEKEEIKKRIGRSPDVGEAILLAGMLSSPSLPLDDDLTEDKGRWNATGDRARGSRWRR